MELGNVIDNLQEAAVYFRSSFDAMYGTAACEKFMAWTNAIELAAVLLKAQEPRVMTLEVAKEARNCWIEERDVGIVYPAIYECIGNPSKYGQFSVFTVVSDADILPEELDDDEKIVCDFEEGHRWLWEADYNDVWRCWTSRPTDEQREAEPWQ